MKLLSGPSEAHRTKNGTFKQLYRPIVVMDQQSAGGPQSSRRIHYALYKKSLMSEHETLTTAGKARMTLTWKKPSAKKIIGLFSYAHP